MIKKILLSCIVFTISYCAVFSEEIIKWSVIGSTDIMECPYSQYNKRYIFKQTSCEWVFTQCQKWGRCFNQTNDRIKVINNQSIEIVYLKISNVSMEDQGDYVCYCKYEYEIQLIYRLYRLKIKGQPGFLEKDENNTLQGTEGNNLTLTCVLEEGLAQEILLLTSDGINVAYGGPEYLNYTFIPSRADHLADYICIANSSEFDNPLVDRVTLYIRHIPDPPTFVLSKTCSRFISWTAGAGGNLPQVFYIEYKKLQSKLWERIGPINQTDSTEITYQISELSLDTFYEIRIFAENEIGRSIYSSVLRTIASDINSTTEDNFASKHVIPLKYWLVLGAVSGSLIFFCILSHACRHRVTHIPVVATNNRELETLYEEIGSLQYHFISVAPDIPAPRQDNIQLNSNRYEIERQNSSWRSSDNANPTLSDNGSGQTIVERAVIGEMVHLRSFYLHEADDNLEPNNHTLEEETDNAEHYENPYTPLRQEPNQEHPYNLCSTSSVFQEQNAHTIVDNDYINLML